MFNLSRERDEIAGPSTSSRQSHSPFPSHPEAPPKDEWPLASSIRGQDYGIYGLYCADPSIPAPGALWTQQTQTAFGIPPFSRILEYDCYERLAKKPGFADTPCGRDRKRLLTHPVHSLPDLYAAAENSHEHERAPLHLNITPPLAPC